MIEQYNEPNNEGTSEEFELEMIKMTLLLDPKNQELSPEELERKAVQELKESK